MSDSLRRHEMAGIESSHAAARSRLAALRAAGTLELTTQQVAAVCGVHASQIRRWRRTRGLYAPRWKGGPTPIAELERWVGTQPDPLNRKGRRPAPRVAGGAGELAATAIASASAPRVPRPPTRRIWV